VTREEHETEVRSWGEGVCQECGNPFPQRQEYEKSCPVCFKISRDYKVLWGDQAFLWLQEKLQETQAELHTARRELKAASQKKAAPPPRLRGGLLRQVIALCHPDHHGGSDRATKVTQQLLAMRSKTPKKRKP
jgi:hypothetical protein